MRWATLVPEKNGMESLMRALNEAEIKEEIIPVHMNQGKTSKKHMKYKGETPTVMVYEGQINKIKTLPVPTEEQWRQATSEDHDLGYIKRILCSPEETPIDSK